VIKNTDQDLIPILITPWGRNGSTLFMELLASNPLVAMGREYAYEAYYLTYLVKMADLLEPGPSQNGALGKLRALRRKLLALDKRKGVKESAWSDLQPFQPVKIENLTPLPNSRDNVLDRDGFPALALKALWSAFSRSARSTADGAAEELRPTHYAEKFQLFDLPRVRSALTPKVIHLIRDPRDIWLSSKAFNLKRKDYSFGWQPEMDEPAMVRIHAKVFKNYMVQVKEGLALGDSAIFLYEDYIADPQGQTGKLSQWLGLELDLDQALDRQDYLGRHMTSGSPEQSVARWKRELDPKLGRIYVDILGGELEYLGYQV
jgi:hypothetical protein